MSKKPSRRSRKHWTVDEKAALPDLVKEYRDDQIASLLDRTTGSIVAMRAELGILRMEQPEALKKAPDLALVRVDAPVVTIEKEDAVSVQWGTERDGCPYQDMVPEGRPCFYCLRPLSYPFQIWRGAEELVLHPDCAIDLARQLLIDNATVRAGHEGWMRKRNEMARARAGWYLLDQQERGNILQYVRGRGPVHPGDVASFLVEERTGARGFARDGEDRIAARHIQLLVSAGDLVYQPDGRIAVPVKQK